VLGEFTPCTRAVQGVVVLIATALLATACSSGSTGTTREVDAELRGILTDLTALWTRTYPGQVLHAPALVLTSGTYDTGCGPNTADDGSFFCVDDGVVYLQQEDLDLLDELPDQDRRAGRVYLLAHEYGHYVQDLLNVPEGDEGTGPDRDSVHYEQQADCLAGVYVATRRDDITPDAYTDAVRDGGDDVGEDPLPSREYEHGTGDQRVAAFTRGLRAAPTGCINEP
jgi:predicted metalloprotease